MSVSSERLALFRLSASAVFCATLLGACDTIGGGGDGATRTETVSVPGGSLRIEEKDIEAPDVFKMRAKGLWDGRPSLGGIWVAVPQDVQPDRVRITNLDNGKQIIGSLFHREVDLPGPPIMVSSDAAVAVGLVPGSPVEMEVIVMRRETVEVVTQQPVSEVLAADADAEDGAAQDQEGAAATDAPEGIATAALESSVLGALEATEDAATPPAAPAPADKPADAPAAPAEAAAATPAVATPAAAASAVRNPYIQIASVTTPKAANDIVRKLQAGGVAAETRVTGTAGKSRFRVVAGPVASAAEQTAQLKKIRALGFKDAFPVK